MPERIPLILLPGLLCDSILWAHQVVHLADRAAPQVANLTQDDHVAAMARRVLDHAPERFALAALSMGGYVAFEIMRQAPERVSRLCLIDTSARPDTEEQARRRRGLLALARTGKFKGVTPRLLPQLIHHDRIDEPELANAVMDMAERVGQAAFLRQQSAILARPDSRPTLASIRCPTLAICGEQDQLTPPELSQEIAAGAPNARLELIPDCGHLAPMERPERVTALMREWLAS